jgi:hypothetical protein
MTRNGKIARLPRSLRDELNQRLARNEDGTTLLDWLNALPDVKDLLARDFAGEPVRQQNLHEWRQGGFVEWQARQDLFAAAADLTDANGEWDALAANDFTERLAAVVVVRYADALAGWKGGDDETFRLKLRDLRRFNQDLAVLRRYNQTAARLKMEQLPFYREEQRRAEAAESARRQSEAGARAHDERVAQRRREAEAAEKVASAASATSAPSAASMPSAPLMPAAASPTQAPARTGAAVAINAGSPRFGFGAESGKEVPAQGAANGAPAMVEPDATPRFGCQTELPVKPSKTNGPEFRTSSNRSPATESPTNEVAPVAPAAENASAQPVAGRSNAEKCPAGGSMEAGAAIMAAGLIRTNLVIKFVDSLRNASLVIEKRSSDAMKLKDRRAVQEAYAGSVATVNRLAKEVGCLRAVLSGFVGVDHVSAAVEGLQREYPRMKPNLFQGFPAALTVGIQQLRDAACELGDTLRQTTATGASLAARIS